MKSTEIDNLIANLGATLMKNGESFEDLAKQQKGHVSIDDLPYYLTKLHNPPPVHPDIKQEELGLGTWMAVCQYAIFELIYQLDVQALPTLKEIAYGKYDWTQATALEVLCRLYIDGKLGADIISEIDSRLKGMRYETYLYFTRSLLKRKERDERFNEIITQLKDIVFRVTLAELGHQLPPMSRDELIELGKKIMAGTSEEDISDFKELFDASVPHPDGSNLFYYPENFNADTDNISDYNPTVEEVVDKCLNYKPNPNGNAAE